MSGREVLIGVTGGVAAYKSAMLVSQLVQSGAEVSVAMTAAATRFIGAATFAALTGRGVAEEIFDAAQFPLGAHITLAQRAEVYCIAPATANFLASAAHGHADDLVTTLFLSFEGPVLVAPAMNCQMWESPAVQRNVDQLRADGVRVIDPEEGWLSCRTRGSGRMAHPDIIQAEIEQALQKA